MGSDHRFDAHRSLTLVLASLAAVATELAISPSYRSPARAVLLVGGLWMAALLPAGAVPRADGGRTPAAVGESRLDRGYDPAIYRLRSGDRRSGADALTDRGTLHCRFAEYRDGGGALQPLAGHGRSGRRGGPVRGRLFVLVGDRPGPALLPVRVRPGGLTMADDAPMAECHAPGCGRQQQGIAGGRRGRGVWGTAGSGRRRRVALSQRAGQRGSLELDRHPPGGHGL